MVHYIDLSSNYLCSSIQYDVSMLEQKLVSLPAFVRSTKRGGGP
jgi:hypothetical protein